METLLRAMGEMVPIATADARQMKIAELHFNEEGEIRFEKDIQKVFDEHGLEYKGILIADIFGDFAEIMNRIYDEHLILRKHKWRVRHTGHFLYK